MNILCKTILLFTVIMFASCCKYDREVRVALQYAGKNREELKKVLDYYCTQDIDDEKYEAAVYLIKNMPFHLSFPADTYMQYAEDVDSLFLSQKNKDSLISCIKRISEKYRSAMRPQYDIASISADYMIWNIDYSFETWKTSPFLEHLSFDDFCEYVLPYKCVELQPINKWKEVYSTQYRGELDLLSQFSDLKHNAKAAVEASQTELKYTIVRGVQSFTCIPLVDLKALEHLGIATCKERAILGLMNSRSKGIPVSLDTTPIWADRTNPHYWNNVYYGQRNNIYYDPIFSRLGVVHNLDTPCSKIYRYSYSPDEVLLEAKLNDRYFPKSLSNVFVKDVTSEYCRTSNLEIKITKKGLQKLKYAYLCTSEGDMWHPVSVSRIRKGKVIYRDVGRNVLYMVVSYGENGQIPLVKPFIVNAKGDVRWIEINKEKHVDITIDRKFPAFQHIFKIKDRLGEFIVENSTDGRDFKKQGGTDINTLLSGKIDIHDSVPKRYWRIRSIKDTISELAEVYFYEKDSIAPMPRVFTIIGSEKDKSGQDVSNLFDGDPLTNYSLYPFTDVVYDFEKDVLIDHVSYIRRGDGNDICPGEVYALYYWEDKWILHDMVVANDVFLTFTNLPSEGLYYIECSTYGNQNRIFIYENNEIRWY